MPSAAALPDAAHDAYGHVQVSEEVLLLTTELLHPLQVALRDGRFEARDLFTEGALVRDVTAVSATKHPTIAGAKTLSATIAETETVTMAPLLKAIDRARFSAVDGGFVDEARTLFRSEHQLALRSATRAWTLRIAMLWVRDDATQPPTWRISRWETVSAEGLETETRWFREALDDVLAKEDVERARRSLHEEEVVAFLGRGGRSPKHPLFSIVSHDRHPSVAAVDIDGNGWDDLYVTARWGKNQLLLNEGGTFREAAADFGLDIEAHTGAALFADLDNDGDQDALLGGTLEPSRLYENVNGNFEPRDLDVLPDAVASLSAADVDNDGLLDVYISTYAFKGSSKTNPHPPPATRPHHTSVLSEIGPANVLLRNQGGMKLALSDELAIRRHTYQATWSDYDNDGDQDVYLANDYAPNNLMRNRGDGTFEDVTDATKTADQGFGMSASWGDVDHDGRFDLYVSNMYSKAGARITSKLGGLDPRFAKMALGNTLLMQGESGFEVSRQDVVRKTGWSWASQFVDVDADTWLDLVVLNGYFTPPRAIAKPVDG